MAIVEEKVKPERDGQKRRCACVNEWWQFAEKPTGPCARQSPTSTACLSPDVRPRSRTIAFASSAHGMVYSQACTVFPIDTYAAFASLQSRVHEVWARFFGATLEDDLRYTPSDCFETFPFRVCLG